MARRAYIAPSDDQRCKADRKPLRDGSDARCMRRAVIDGFCLQHARMAGHRFCEYCGGNDETPQDHTMDCTRPI